MKLEWQYGKVAFVEVFDTGRFYGHTTMTKAGWRWFATDGQSVPAPKESDIAPPEPTERGHGVEKTKEAAQANAETWVKTRLESAP